MKTLIALTLLLPAYALAQVATGSTAPGLEDVIGTIPSIIEAFKSGGLWAGIVAIFGALGVALNFGPLKAWLAASPLDWLRPLVMLLGVGVTAAVGSSVAGANLLGAVLAGVMAGIGSGYVQKLIQEIRD